MRLRNRDNLMIRTPYGQHRALERLRAHTVARPGDGGGEACFCGDIPPGGTAFTLRPLCRVRNFWLPVLQCTIAAEAAGSMIVVNAKCERITRIFMAAWYVLLAQITALVLLVSFLDGFHGTVLSVALLLWAAGVLLPRLCFRRPMNRAKQDLRRILKAERA